MKHKMFATWGMIIILLVSVFGTAAAQTGTDPEGTPAGTPTTQPARSRFYSHPVVQILSAYFGREKAATQPVDPAETATPVGTPDPSVTPDPAATDDPSVTVTPDPSATPEPEELISEQERIAQEIAQYHEEGMGFGVLVKLYAMAEAAADAAAIAGDESCATQPEPTGDVPAGEQPACAVVTVDELVTAFQGGAGMGSLFKEYGKPAMLGVGHVKKAAKNMEGQPTEVVDDDLDGTTEPDETLSAGTDETEMSGQTRGKTYKPAKVKTPKAKGRNK